jgi:hypothetical protein
MNRQQTLLQYPRSPPYCARPTPDSLNNHSPRPRHAEKTPIGLVVALPRQSHQCGEIVQVSQRGRSFTYSCAQAKTLQRRERKNSRRA